MPKYTDSEFSRNCMDFNLINRLEHYVPERTATLPKFHSFEKNQIEELLKIMFEAQLTKNPSDVAFIMTKNQYILFGELMKKMKQPFKMRLSKYPVSDNKYDIDVEGSWSIMKHSLLLEPLSYSLHKIRV